MSGFWPDPTERDRAAFADAEVRPFWLAALPPRDPAPPLSGHGRHRPVHRRRRVHRPVGGAAREGRRPGARGRPARGGHDRLRRERPQRRLRHELADARAGERARAVRGGDAGPRAPRGGEPRRDAGRPRAPRDRLPARARRGPRRDPRAVPGGVDRGRGRGAAALRPRRRGVRRAGDARRGRVADVPGGDLGPDRRGPARPRSPRRRAAGGGAAGGGADLRGHAGRGARAARARRRRRGRRRRRPGPRARGAARDERVPAAAARDPPLHRPGLRLRARHRAAERRPARRDRVAPAPGAVGRREPVPLLPPHARRPDPVRRLRRRVPLRRPGRPGPRRRRRMRSRGCRRTSSTRSRNSRACGSRTAGAARSTPRAASRCSSATALGGRVAYAVGYTGLGVGATRFGARVALDLLDGRETEATRLRYVRSRPVPFPPEPLRWAVVQFTRNRLAAADLRDGRRGLWLRTLDRLGLGFDS